MSATTLTQTTIKTQSVTGFHHHHQPSLVSTPCIIQSPAVQLQRRPVRCSARLISQTSSSILTAAPITTKLRRRRAATKNSSSRTTHQLRLSIGHSGPSFISTIASGNPDPPPPSSHSPQIDRPQPLSHPGPGSPARQKPFPSLLPLQLVSPIVDKTSPQPCSLRFTFFFPSHLPKPPLLSLPKAPILSHLVFHFPLSTPARHLPPPYPGPRPLISPPSHSQPLQEQPYYHHRLPTNYLSSTFESYWPRSKRRVALPQEHYLRSKKIKLHHSFFRSPQVLYPVDYSLNTSASPGNPSGMSSRPKLVENPKWLHTSPAAQGQPSKMSPGESQWTGTPASWISNKKPSLTPRASSSATSLPRMAPLVKPHRLPQPAFPGGPQAAPLKAQLLAVLRMRSSLQPGEAALRLKKWVIWNSWVRGRGQMRVYPIVNPHQPNSQIIAPSPSRPPTRTGSSTSDDWTGDEMFDDNGDLICEEEEEEPIQAAGDVNRWSRRPGSEKSSTAMSATWVPRKSQTIIKLKIPPRTPTAQQYSLQPTPPASPVSHTNPGQAPSAQKNTNGSSPSPSGSQAQPTTTVADRSPLTPPPSPPNQHPRE